jgi:uncharacterized hydrophobic protein (TIGR00271 family)
VKFDRSHFNRILEAVAEPLAPREKTRAAVASGAKLSGAYFVMNAAATLIAGYGLLANSEAVIIGAMLIAMLYGPILGLGLALAELDARLLAQAAIAEILGVIWVLALGVAIGLLHARMPITNQILARTAPNLLDLMIALAGGAAGAYAVSAPRVSSAMVGVAIATALCPPLTACGILLAYDLPTLAGGAALLFFTNLVAIAAAAMAVFLLMGHRAPARGGRFNVSHAARIAPLLTLAALGVYLIQVLRENVEEARTRGAASQAVEKELSGMPGAHVVEIRLERGADGKKVAYAVIRAPTPLSRETVALLDDAVARAAGQDLCLHVRTVIVDEMTRAGPFFATAPDDLKALR